MSFDDFYLLATVVMMVGEVCAAVVVDSPLTSPCSPRLSAEPRPPRPRRTPPTRPRPRPAVSVAESIEGAAFPRPPRPVSRRGCVNEDLLSRSLRQVESIYKLLI